MDYKKILFSNHYYTKLDLRFNNKFKFFFSNEKLIEYKKYKDELLDNKEKGMVDIPLKTFNSRHIFYVESEALKTLFDQYYSIIKMDNDLFESIIEKKKEDIILSRVFSEVEGTLLVENVPTTRTRIQNIYKGDTLKDKNDIIIKNMIDGISFVFQKPVFNKANLLKLYNILSRNCLEDNQKIKNYYRDDMVYVGDYEGCEVDKIEECMDSLFNYVKMSLESPKSKKMLPHICHYYILYVHPYFDFNGRIARIVSLWISLLIGEENSLPLFISEAINDNKKKYYDALSETRDMNNDLSYFLIYIANVSISYALTYKNIDYIEQELLSRNILLTSQDRFYLKRILINSNDYSFDFKRFISFSNVDISKQAALKLLNKFNEEYGILFSVINDKKIKLFKLNPSLILFSGNSF